MPLQTIYRPDRLDTFAGNEESVNSLKSALNREEDIPHAFLFTGPSGTGKTTLARIVKNVLECEGADYIELNGADFRGIDTIRSMRRQASLKAMNGKCRIWLLDECHQLSGDAQEALLKLLEDAPNHSYFILATTDPQKLKTTLKRRCFQIQLSPLSNSGMKDLLKSVIEKEGLNEDDFNKKILNSIHEKSDGSPGRALGLLDSIIDLDPEEQQVVIDKHIKNEQEAIDLCRKLSKVAGSGDPKDWKTIAKILSNLKESGEDAEGIRLLMMAYCQSALLKNDNPQLGLVACELIDTNFYYTKFAGLVVKCYEIVMG